MVRNDINKYNITESESKKLQIVKFIFCIMVVFIHSYGEEIHFADNNITLNVPIWLQNIKYIISQIICRCAVPGFFIISSVLLYKSNYLLKDKIKTKIKTLIVPYILLNSFWIIFFYISQNINFLKVYFSNEDMIIKNWGIFEWVNAYLGITGYPILVQLWFLRDLFVLFLLSKVIKIICDRFPKTVFAIIIIILLTNLKTHLFFLSGQDIAYFVLGYYIVKKDIHIDMFDKINILTISIIYIVTITLTFIGRYTLFVDAIKVLSNIMGLIFTAKIASLIYNNNKISKIFINTAKYGFSIYLFHELTLTITKKILIKILPNNTLFQILEYFGIPIIIIVFCILLSKILERYTPKIYSLLTGNRIK